jgi:hypothetical protein
VLPVAGNLREGPAVSTFGGRLWKAVGMGSSESLHGAEAGGVVASSGGGRINLGRWVLANVVAFTAAGAIGGTLLRSWQQPYYEHVPSMGQAVVVELWTVGLTWTIFGLFVGAAQWWVIRRNIAASWWLPATVVGWMLSGIGVGVLSGIAGGSMSEIGPTSVPAWLSLTSFAGFALVGLLPGTFQWLTQRRHIESVTWWPVCTLVGLAVGFGAGLVVARGFVSVIPVFLDTDFPSGKVLTMVGAVAGAVYASVTGQVLAKAVRRS